MAVVLSGSPSTCSGRPALGLSAIKPPLLVLPLKRHSSALARQHSYPRGGRPATAILASQQQEEAAAEIDDRAPPPGCARYTVSLGKPLGLVLEENRDGGIFVAEVVEGGNADKSGEVSVGDQLIATSGFTYTTQQKYQDNWVKGGEQVIRLNVRGEDFKTVMAAISSHPGNMKVVLEFQRC